MRYCKKFLLYLMMILIVTVSFSKDENRITIFERDNEPAKLKIGVTKLITKELPMDYHVEKKLIYCELPEEISENDTIYVSETLDEIPSTSTTSGRKTINNIKKYLTKEIKANSRFNYRIIKKEDEKSGEERKYIVIHCKEEVQNLYLYVVEKSSFKMKELYRGKFATTYADESKEDIDYGTINFTTKNSLQNGDIITGEGKDSINNIIVKRGTTILKPSEDVAKIYGDKGFPKKYFVKGGLYAQQSKVVLKVGNSEAVQTGFSFKNGLYDITIPINTVDKDLRAVREELRIYTKENSDFIHIELKNWDNNFSSINMPVTIEYWCDLPGLHEEYKIYKIDNFNLNIETKEQFLAKNNESSIEILPTEYLHQETTVVYDGRKVELKQGGNTIQNSSKYVKLSRGYLNKFVAGGTESKVQIIQNGNIVKEGIVVSRDGDFDSQVINLYGANYGQEIGWIRIFADSTTGVGEQNKYLKYKTKITMPYRDTVVSDIQIRYYTESGIKKVDKLKLVINPAEEEAFEETTGGIYVTNPSGLNCAVISVIDNNIQVGADTDAERFKPENAKVLGRFPKRLTNINDKVHDWGGDQRVFITNENETGVKAEFYLDGQGRFNTSMREIMALSKDKDHTAYKDPEKHPCNIAIGCTGKESLEIAIFDYNANAKTVLNKILKLEYQVEVSPNVWVTKKTDRLKILIQPHSMSGNVPKIKIHNPVVWYEYNPRGARNISHEKEAELLYSTAKTYDRYEKVFNLNTDLAGREWIECTDIPAYTWWDRHKIEINTGAGEVVKNTDSNGKTKSTTFIKLNRGNVVGVAYDGKDPSDSTGQTDRSLSFGVAKYDFNGGKGKFIIGQYNTSGVLEQVQEYNVEIDRFDGREYVDPTKDIRVKQDYVKVYEFKHELETQPVDIDYGVVGFRKLDTRITNQSGGDGIEFRMAENITLVGQGEYSNYRVPATLKFVTDIGTNPNMIRQETVNGKKYWIFKGNNEEATAVKIVLHIDSQEALIPSQARFKLVDEETQTKSPLKVGVVVNNDKEKYFEEVTDLYLNTGIGRLVKTELVFENVKIQSQALEQGSNQMKWIKLNKTDYPNGHIDNYKGENWGSVREEVVDIPNELGALKIELKDKDYNDIGKLSDGQIHQIDIEKNIFEIKYDNSNYISFRLNNPNNQDYISNQSDKFYIRVSKVDLASKKETYLFTQEYSVTFNEGVGYTGSTTLDIKNPMMSINGENGYITIDKHTNAGGTVAGNGNHNTKYDSEKWWIVQNGVNYPDIDKYNYHIYEDEEFVTEANLSDIDIRFIKTNSLDDYSSLKVGLNNQNYDGRVINKTYYIKWSEKVQGDVHWERKDKVTINREQFDPTYYGKVFPSDTIDDNGANSYKEMCEVGNGFENLTKDDTQNDRYIDLNTSYRDYQRYFGILEQVGTKEEFIVRGKANIVAIKSGETVTNRKEIQGMLVFREDIESAVTPVEEVVVKPNQNSLSPENLKDPTKYKLYFKVKANEYNKLDYNTKYELVVSGTTDGDVVEIGYKNKINDLGCQPMKLKNRLNFTTSKQPFIIDTYTLDFGTINIYFNDGTTIKKHGKTYVTLSGEEIKNITLKIADNHVIENGKATTYINRYDINGVDQNVKLKVKNIDLVEQKELPKPQTRGAKAIEQKIYRLDADLEVPLDSQIGNYIGAIYINSTIIN